MAKRFALPHKVTAAKVPELIAAVAGGKRTVIGFSEIDNLIQGGAGQAIQRTHLMLGCDERASLEDVGNWP